MKQIKPINERAALSKNTVHENPVINRVLQNRNVESIADVEYSLKDLIDPFTMQNMKEAVALIEKHIRNKGKILIVGDFDCDGATSTSIAVAGLEMMGAKDVKFIIPDRVIHGYGLTPSIVKLAEELDPDLIITVDNGIASFEGAEAVRAMKKKCDLLVTDHHLAAERGMPDADVIINPNQPTCGFESKNLAGCGVIFYAIMALRTTLRENGYFKEMGMKEPLISELLDLVALGTVADVVPLDKNNRILIDAGLSRIRRGLSRPGIQALLEISKRDPLKVVASDMGFSLGPRINAAGRLDDMTMGINCLLSKSHEEAMSIAVRLDELNLQRREIEADHVIDAGALIEDNGLDERKGVVMFDNTWHPGVVGIVSSRIKDRLNRPVICMTDGDGAKSKRAELALMISQKAPKEWIDQCKQELDECEIKGSARSIPGLHLKHILDHISKKNPDILSKFGGHAMAAGLTLKYKDLERFSDIFNDEIAKDITEAQLLGNIDVDIKNVDGSRMTMEMAEALQALGPWGQMFPEPNFHAKFRSVKEPRIMKEKHAKFTITMDGSDEVFEAVAFNSVENGEVCVGDTFDASFCLDINEYRGSRKLQLMIRDLQPISKDLVLESGKNNPPDNKPVQSSFAEESTLKEKMPPSDNTKKGSSKIAGAGSAARNANPVTRMHDDMSSALDLIKASIGSRKIKINNEDPSPF